MGILRWLRRFISILSLVVTSTTCSSVPPPPGPAPNPCKYEVKFWVDPEFTAEQTLIVVQSVYAWQEASGRRICFSGAEFDEGLRIHRVHLPDVARSIEARGLVSSGGHPDKVVGLANYPDAYVLTEKLHTEQALYATSIHELGHLLGLSHYEPEKTCHDSSLGLSVPEPSWMYPSIDRDPQDSREVPTRDVRALFSLDRWR